jgi:hypothetical protein
MRVSEARENVGRLSNPSKMPSKSYGLPAQACKVGGKLRASKGRLARIATLTTAECMAFQ